MRFNSLFVQWTLLIAILAMVWWALPTWRHSAICVLAGVAIGQALGAARRR